MALLDNEGDGLFLEFLFSMITSEASPQTDEMDRRARERSFAGKLDTFVKFLRLKDA